ncbi:MAG: hypothetical protein IKQ54_02580 [Oscillospiraceae bacterium]|nr:hypothetical protein [Oscillospiraceae bacterium]
MQGELPMRNEAFLKTALACLPTPKEKLVPAVRCLRFERTEDGIRAVETERKPMKKGDKLCFDFGNHQVGYLSLKLGSAGSHPDAPAWIRLQFAEQQIELFERAEDYHGWISTSWIQTEQLHVDVLPCTLHLPRRYAFRYVQLEVMDVSSKYRLTVEEALCTAVSSADEARLTPLASGDEQLDRMDAVACRTLHNCMQQVFEDGPKRDRRLWLGDLRLQAQANYRTYRNLDMVKGCLYLFAALPREDGLLSAAIFLEPEPEADDTCLPDYSMLFVPALLDYYEASRDSDTLRELWPTALRQLEQANERLQDGVFPDSDRLGWCFIDWSLELNKQAALMGVYLYCLQAGEKIAALLSDPVQALLRARWDAGLRAARARFWDETAGCFVSGAARQISWASQIWMVLGGVLSKQEAAALFTRMEGMEALGMITPYAYHHYVQALLEIGQGQKALSVLKQYWGGMVERGADTFWELYDPENPQASPYGGTVVNSYCHAWSCGPAYFLRNQQTGM